MTDSYAEIGKRFRKARIAARMSQSDAAKKLGVSARTIGSLERGEHVGESTVELVEMAIKGWGKEEAPRLVSEPRLPYVIHDAIRVAELNDPLEVLKGGLVNTVLMLRDDAIPLRERLLHTRGQLEFLLRNFLQDASLPPGPEGSA